MTISERLRHPYTMETLADVETIVRLVLEQEEHYTTDATPLTPDHVFGQHVLELRPRKVKLLPKSAAHLEQRIRAITASVLDTLGGVS